MNATVRVGEDVIDGTVAKLLMIGRQMPLHAGSRYAMCRAEVAVVETPQFQRLGRLRQMGLSYTAYPNAQHTRYEHSIGTAYWSLRILNELRVSSVTGNFSSSEPILLEIQKSCGNTVSFELVLRLYSLLHDVALLPLGHTLKYQLGIGSDAVEQTRLATSLVTAIGATIHTRPRCLNQDEVDVLLRHLQHVADIMSMHGMHDGGQQLNYPELLDVYHFVEELATGPLGADIFDYAQRDTQAMGHDTELPFDALLSSVAAFELSAGSARRWRFGYAISENVAESAHGLCALIEARSRIMIDGVLSLGKQGIDALFDMALHLVLMSDMKSILEEQKLIGQGDEDFLHEVCRALRWQSGSTEPAAQARELAFLLESRTVPTHVALIKGATLPAFVNSDGISTAQRRELGEHLRKCFASSTDALFFVAAPQRGMQGKPLDVLCQVHTMAPALLEQTLAHVGVSLPNYMERYRSAWGLNVFAVGFGSALPRAADISREVCQFFANRS